MRLRPLGRTGVMVAPLALGALNFGVSTPEADAIRILHKAIDAGINLVDTANVYGAGESERIVGKALAQGKRNRVILATKVHSPTSDSPNDRGGSRFHILNAVEDSLRRLQTDRIDIYQMHRPDFDFPQDETIRALDDLVHQGKVRYIGTSTFPAWLIMESLAISERYGLARYVTEQPAYNLLDRRIENELVPLALRYNIALLPWSPLAMGTLAGHYERETEATANSRIARYGLWGSGRLTERAITAAKQVAQLASSRGLTQPQLAIGWIKEQPGVVTPIIGPRTEGQLDDALAIVDMSIDPDLAAALDEIVPPGSAVADFHNNSGWMKMKLS